MLFETINLRHTPNTRLHCSGFQGNSLHAATQVRVLEVTAAATLFAADNGRQPFPCSGLVHSARRWACQAGRQVSAWALLPQRPPWPHSWAEGLLGKRSDGSQRRAQHPGVIGVPVSTLQHESGGHKSRCQEQWVI